MQSPRLPTAKRFGTMIHAISTGEFPMEQERLNEEQFEKFRQFLYKVAGVKIEPTKITLASNRIRRRLKATGINDFDAYYRYLTSVAGKAEVAGFLDALTTNETSFYRTASHFEWFSGPFLDDLIARRSQGRHSPAIRIWSAACSSGEEPYTLAICLQENRLRLAGWQWSILGTDISTQMLERAREGIYPSRAVEGIDPQRLRRYFQADKSGQNWVVGKTLRDHVSFQQHNLMEPMRSEPFDCIFLRNVMIYFDRESKKKALQHLIASLAPEGYLVVGPSEGVFDMLDSLQKRSTFLYQKP